MITIELRNKMGLILQTIQGVAGEYTKEVSLEAYQGGMIYYHLMSKGVELDAGQIILNK